MICLRLLLLSLVGAVELLSITERELLSSQLWKRNVAHLFFIRQSNGGHINTYLCAYNCVSVIAANPIPAEVLDLVRVELAATVVQVCLASKLVCGVFSMTTAAILRGIP